jgi:ribosomal protein S18 acetylase RimI-like enzyme
MTPTDFVVRVFEDTDEPAVVALWRQVFPEDPPWNEPTAVVRRKLAVQRELFLVGELNGVVVAAVLAGFDGFRGWLYHLAVAPAQRRRGLGRALVLEAERRLRDLGCPKINAQIRAGNTVSVQFCEAMGFTVEERVSVGKRLT